MSVPSPGMSMELLETRRGVQYFAFKHHHKYQQLQFKFLEAVESMNLNNIVVCWEMVFPLLRSCSPLPQGRRWAAASQGLFFLALILSSKNPRPLCVGQGSSAC